MGKKTRSPRIEVQEVRAPVVHYHILIRTREQILKVWPVPYKFKIVNIENLHSIPVNA